MDTDGSETNRKPWSRRKRLALMIAAPALASVGLAPAGIAQLGDLTWVSPSCGAIAAGAYGLVKWLKARGYSLRVVLERQPAEQAPVDVSAEFELVFAEDETQHQNLARMHATPEGIEDATLLLVQRLLRVPDPEWTEDAESEVWRWAADRRTQPYHRVVIATAMAQRNQAKGVTLLVQIAREGNLGAAIRLMAADELRRWDRHVAAAEYDHLSADERISPADRILAGTRLGMLDAVLGAAALLAIVQDPRLDFCDRFNAAEQSGSIAPDARVQALWVLAHDSAEAMTDRVSASGRLLQLGIPGAQKLLENGAKNLGADPIAQERCRRFLAEVRPQ
jgi:hypothetical protein